MLIQQQTHQLRDSQRRMGVIKLDHFMIGQGFDAASGPMMATQNVSQCAGALKILLHQTQFFTVLMIVIGVEHFGEFFSINTLLFRAQKVAVVKATEVKRLGMFRLP